MKFDGEEKLRLLHFFQLKPAELERCVPEAKARVGAAKPDALSDRLAAAAAEVLAKMGKGTSITAAFKTSLMGRHGLSSNQVEGVIKEQEEAFAGEELVTA